VRVEGLANGGARYTVADNGCGLSGAARANLFTAFFSTKGAGGSGLGLMTTKKIVEEHGGSISATARQQGGTEFDIIIPGKYDNKVA